MAVDIKMIKELRELTGAGVLDVKNALESCGGDMEAAAKALREKGLVRAAKRADRATKEGRVEARSSDGRDGLLVEINCETDFVGQNESFVAFCTAVADHFFAFSKPDQPLESLIETEIEDGATAASMLQDLISSTGENMAIRRYDRFQLGDEPGLIEVYLHPGNRVAVMIEMTAKNAAAAGSEAFATLAHDLALHIAAQAPVCVAREHLPAAKLEALKESYRQGALREGKPERIIDRIVKGRLRKFYEQSVLLEQPFVKDDEITVTEVLKQGAETIGYDVKVERFARYELGEELD